MPTAAKLVAALSLAALGYLASEMVKTLMTERTAFGSFSLLNAGLGFLCGWIVIGSRAGRGMAAAVSNGLTGVVALVFWALFIQSVAEMVRLSLARRYDSPVEAFAAIFEIMVAYGTVLLNGSLIVLLLVGALVCGLLAEIGARRWR